MVRRTCSTVQLYCIFKVVRLESDNADQIPFLARHLASGRLVCVRLRCPSNTSFDDVAVEASMLEYLNTTKVTPQFFGVVVVPDDSAYSKYGIVTEFLGHSVSFEVASVRSLLTANNETPSVNWIQLCADLVSAVNVINKKGVVINNGLNADNVLLKQIDGRWSVCVSDFSLSCYSDYTFDRKRLQQKHGSFESSVAPEVIDTAHCSAASDMYLVGCVIIQIATLTNSCVLEGIAGKCLRRDINERIRGRVLLRLLETALDASRDRQQQIRS